MKKLLSLALSAIVVAGMALTAGAADNEVLKGTPVVDGTLDEIYTQSTSLALENLCFYPWGGFADDADHAATAYFLWDDNYLYVCVVVTDPEVMDVGAAKYEANPFNWQAEATELWFDEGYGKWKTHFEAHGHAGFVQAGNADPSFTTEDVVSATSITADGYITEYALPVETLGVDGTIGVSVQVNDQVEVDDGEGVGYASGIQDANIMLTFVATEVEVAEVETEAETVADAAGEETTATQTFDAGIVAAVAAIVSAAGYAISKKR